MGSTRLCLLSTGVKGMYHHAWPWSSIFKLNGASCWDQDLPRQMVVIHVPPMHTGSVFPWSHHTDMYLWAYIPESQKDYCCCPCAQPLPATLDLCWCLAGDLLMSPLMSPCHSCHTQSDLGVGSETVTHFEGCNRMLSGQNKVWFHAIVTAYIPDPWTPLAQSQPMCHPFPVLFIMAPV